MPSLTVVMMSGTTKDTSHATVHNHKLYAEKQVSKETPESIAAA
jgi:hypothetical protein